MPIGSFFLYFLLIYYEEYLFSIYREKKYEINRLYKKEEVLRFSETCLSIQLKGRHKLNNF